MRLHPFFKYFGSKFRSASKYPKPTRSIIIEPFAGSAGYALNFADHNVILCDNDPRVIAIWRYLIAATPEDILALPLLEPGQHIRTLEVSEPARLFISCCVNSSQFRNVLTAWKNGQNDGLWGSKWRARVSEQVTKIKHWRAVCHDYSGLPNREATWFIDAPYEELDEHYRSTQRNPINYEHLGTWCRSLRGQVIVCERHGAKWLPFKDLGTVPTVRNLGDRTCKEAVWIHENWAPLLEVTPIKSEKVTEQNGRTEEDREEGQQATEEAERRDESDLEAGSSNNGELRLGGRQGQEAQEDRGEAEGPAAQEEGRHGPGREGDSAPEVPPGA